MNSDRRSARASSIDAIAHRLVALRRSHPIRVAVDGRTASGKTTFADHLAAAIERLGRRTIRASIDGLHRPKAVRHRRGKLSSDGYYEDARDVNAMRQLLLDPLGPSGDRLCVTTVFDLERDKPLKPSPHVASEDALLVVDGTFLQRSELRSEWDFVIFLDVPEEVARLRGIRRDSLASGDEASTSDLYLRRYGPALTRYEAECTPVEQADVLIDNSAPI